MFMRMCHFQDSSDSNFLSINIFEECFAPHHRLRSQTVAFDIPSLPRAVACFWACLVGPTAGSGVGVSGAGVRQCTTTKFSHRQLETETPTHVQGDVAAGLRRRHLAGWLAGWRWLAGWLAGRLAGLPGGWPGQRCPDHNPPSTTEGNHLFC